MNWKLITSLGIFVLVSSLSISAEGGGNADLVPVQHAKKAGINKCLSAIKTISEYVIGEDKYGAHDFWNKETPDTGGFSSTIERVFKDGSMIGDINVAHTKNDQCFTTVSKIFYFDQKCLAISNQMKDAKYEGEVASDVTLLTQGGVNVYLMSAGKGCIVMRKEVLHDLK